LDARCEGPTRDWYREMVLGEEELLMKLEREKDEEK
jgi:hypothetical protein